MTALVAPNQLAARVFDAEVPVCPRCAQPVRRVTGGAGSFYAHCDNRLNGARCGQHAHLLAAEGAVVVTPISEDQYRRFKRTYPLARTVYRELGVTITPSRPPEGPDAIPEFRCSGCGVTTKLFDLYAGECRQCRDKRSDASE